MHEEFPISLEHRALLRQLGSEFVYASPLSESAGAPNTWFALVRFGRVLETRFGFTREIPVLYSPFKDLQIRTIGRIPELISRLPAERQDISAEEILVWAQDPELKTKTESWSKADRVLLPLPDQDNLDGSSPVQDFINQLASKLAVFRHECGEFHGNDQEVVVVGQRLSVRPVRPVIRTRLPVGRREPAARPQQQPST